MKVCIRPINVRHLRLLNPVLRSFMKTLASVQNNRFLLICNKASKLSATMMYRYTGICGGYADTRQLLKILVDYTYSTTIQHPLTITIFLVVLYNSFTCKFKHIRRCMSQHFKPIHLYKVNKPKITVHRYPFQFNMWESNINTPISLLIQLVGIEYLNKIIST